MSRGIEIWDTLTIELQRATTKVKETPLSILTVVDLNGTWTE